jgi:hypothetical protein
MKVEEALDHIQRLHDSVSLQEAIRRVRAMIRIADTEEMKACWRDRLFHLESYRARCIIQNMRSSK